MTAHHLTDEHQDYLEAAAIDVDVALAAGVRSVTSADELPAELSTWSTVDGIVPGIVFPAIGPDGRAVPQYRPDMPVRLDGGSDTRKYLFPKGGVPGVNVHPTMADRLNDEGPVWIVEGTKQALAAVTVAPDDVLILGVSGCLGWSVNGAPSPDLCAVPFDGRPVVVMFDADLSNNRAVWDAGERLADVLGSLGAASVKFVKLPAGKKAGLDDYLAPIRADHRAATFRRLADRAGKLPRQPAKRSTRPARNGDDSSEIDGMTDEHSPDPDRFIDRRDGLLAVTLADAVVERVQVARMALHDESDATDPLWIYRTGRWSAGGEKAVEQETVRLLGERHRHSYSRNVLDVIRADPDLPTLTSEAPHPEFINTASGMVRWSTGELVDHDPAFLSTVQVPHPWDLTATCPTVEAWLAEVLPDDGMVEFAFAVIGYLLLNGNPWHRAFLFVGSGRNGKSTMLRLIESLLGRRNCSSVPLQKLGDGHRFASAEMFMRTANVCGDLAATHLKDTSTFKQVTGGDPVFAERKMRDPFSFTWWGVPVFSANAIPGADDTSHGFLSRWEIVNFPVDLTGQVDPSIESRLIAELPGVLVRAVDSLAATMKRGDFHRPAAVTEAKAAFSRHVDQVRGYLEDSTTRDGWTERGDIYADYKLWALRNGHGELASRKFYERLRTAGIEESKRQGQRGFRLTLGSPQRQLGAAGAATSLPAAHTGEREGSLPLLPPLAPNPAAPKPPPDGRLDLRHRPPGGTCERCGVRPRGSFSPLCVQCNNAQDATDTADTQPVSAPPPAVNTGWLD